MTSRPHIHLAGKCLAAWLAVCFLLSLEQATAGQVNHQNRLTPLTNSYVVIGDIHIDGNRITHPRIITRELLFTTNDTIEKNELDAKLTASRSNLLNTGLFNFVAIDLLPDAVFREIVHVHILLTERWYIWPIPIVEIAARNFNEWWESRDFDRINYGIAVRVYNFRGHNDNLDLLMRTGFDQNYRIRYLNNNINRRQTLGLGVGVSLMRGHEVAWGTVNDRRSVVEDDNYLVESLTTNLTLFYRPRIHSIHSFWIQFNQHRFADTLFELNPVFFPGSRSPRFLSLGYEFRSDRRDLRYYPLNGHYISFMLTKHGLSLGNNNSSGIWCAYGTFNVYLPLVPRWFFLAGTTIKASFPKQQPYIFQQSLGFGHDYVRGYEHYVIDGQHFALLRTNLKWELLPKRTIRMRFIPGDKFGRLHLALYLGVHSDVGWVVNRLAGAAFNNKLPNTFLWGNGVGVDLVTYYDKVVRLEYSVNLKGDGRLFLHFLAPI